MAASGPADADGAGGDLTLVVPPVKGPRQDKSSGTEAFRRARVVARKEREGGAARVLR
jgi:hypothetical protein